MDSSARPIWQYVWEQNSPYRSYSTAHEEKTLKTLALVTSAPIKGSAARRHSHHRSAATGKEERPTVFPFFRVRVLLRDIGG